MAAPSTPPTPTQPAPNTYRTAAPSAGYPQPSNPNPPPADTAPRRTQV